MTNEQRVKLLNEMREGLNSLAIGYLDVLTVRKPKTDPHLLCNVIEMDGVEQVVIRLECRAGDTARKI